MSKHTPGPWVLRPHGKYKRAIFGATNALPVAHIHADGANSETNDANARLIAAAPDLLDALREIEAEAAVFGGGFGSWISGCACAAIAKATDV